MAYDDSRFRGEPGFRDEPEFRSRTDTADTSSLGNGSGSLYNPGSYPVTGYPSSGADTSENTLGLTRRTPSAAQLEDVFDDPSHGDPGRDRMAVHFLWEVLLLLATAGVALLLYRGHRSAVTGAGLRDLMVTAATLGFLVLGMGLSLRAAVPNLAVGPIAYGSALFFAAHADRGLVTTAVVTGLLAIAVGAVIAVAVVGFHVPAWAASLGAALGLIVWIEQRTGPLKMTGGGYAPGRHAAFWLGGFAALAVLGGLMGISKPMRRAVGRFRPVADPARRRGAAAGALAALAIVGSSALASVAGVLMASRAGTVTPPNNALTLTGLALGTALVAGTSAYGRRGGVFGTVLAVALVTAVMEYLDVTNRRVAPLAVAAVAIGAGLVVTRLVEAFGRPRSAADADDDWGRAQAASTTSTTSMAEADSWSPNRTGWTTAGTSGDDRWGNGERWGSR
jgi:ribose/xylose/arabinose/galactoside ABC-type transport system permease subunit